MWMYLEIYKSHLKWFKFSHAYSNLVLSMNFGGGDDLHYLGGWLLMVCTFLFRRIPYPPQISHLGFIFYAVSFNLYFVMKSLCSFVMKDLWRMWPVLKHPFYISLLLQILVLLICEMCRKARILLAGRELLVWLLIKIQLFHPPCMEA